MAFRTSVKDTNAWINTLAWAIPTVTIGNCCKRQECVRTGNNKRVICPWSACAKRSVFSECSRPSRLLILFEQRRLHYLLSFTGVSSQNVFSTCHLLILNTFSLLMRQTKDKWKHVFHRCLAVGYWFIYKIDGNLVPYIWRISYVHISNRYLTFMWRNALFHILYTIVSHNSTRTVVYTCTCFNIFVLEVGKRVRGKTATNKICHIGPNWINKLLAIRYINMVFNKQTFYIY